MEQYKAQLTRKEIEDAILNQKSTILDLRPLQLKYFTKAANINLDKNQKLALADFLSNNAENPNDFYTWLNTCKQSLNEVDKIIFYGHDGLSSAFFNASSKTYYKIVLNRTNIIYTPDGMSQQINNYQVTDSDYRTISYDVFTGIIKTQYQTCALIMFGNEVSNVNQEQFFTGIGGLQIERITDSHTIELLKPQISI